MKERPIILSGEEVRALLKGATQIRRVIKPQPYRDLLMKHTMFVGGHVWIRNGKMLADWSSCVSSPESMLLFCPYGQPGDRLWVRETWQAVHPTKDAETGQCDGFQVASSIPADNDPGGIDGLSPPWWAIAYAADECWETHKDDRGFSWRSPIHMPRWASRLLLEVVEVRVELRDGQWEWVITIKPVG